MAGPTAAGDISRRRASTTTGATDASLVRAAPAVFEPSSLASKFAAAMSSRPAPTPRSAANANAAHASRTRLCSGVRWSKSSTSRMSQRSSSSGRGAQAIPERVPSAVQPGRRLDCIPDSLDLASGQATTDVVARPVSQPRDRTRGSAPGQGLHSLARHLVPPLLSQWDPPLRTIVRFLVGRPLPRSSPVMNCVKDWQSFEL